MLSCSKQPKGKLTSPNSHTHSEEKVHTKNARSEWVWRTRPHWRREEIPWIIVCHGSKAEAVAERAGIEGGQSSGFEKRSRKALEGDNPAFMHFIRVEFRYKADLCLW